MALWGSKQSDLQARIDDIQTGLAALAGLLGDGASAAGSKAARGARRASEAAGETAQDISGTVSPALSDIADQIDSVIASVGSLTTRAGDVARKEGKAAYQAVEGKVNENAMVAVVAAAGVGFLLGTLIFGGSAAKRAVSNVLPEALSGDAEQPRRRAAARSRTRGRPKRRKAA